MHMYLYALNAGIFYYVLGNLPPRYRSILHVIQLLCVVQTQIMQKYTINQILMPFMSDLKKLESVSHFICNKQFLCVLCIGIWRAIYSKWGKSQFTWYSCTWLW